VGIDYTTTDLVDSIKRRAVIPTSQQLYPDRDLVKMASEELQSDIVPLMMKMQEEYFVNNYDQAISGTQTEYFMHPRAMGEKLRDAVLLNADGKEVNFPYIGPDTVKRKWSVGSYPYLNNRGWYFEGDKIIITPDTSEITSYQLRQKYYRRPNNLVVVADAGQITLIVGKVLTLSNFPAAWTASTTFDIIKNTPSFRAWGEDLAVSAVDATAKTITLVDAVPDNVAVGNWVAEAGFSPIPQLPYDIFKLLAQRVAVVVLEGLGDATGLKSAADVYKDMVDKFNALINPRADGSPKKVNRGSHFFGGASRSRRTW